MLTKLLQHYDFTEREAKIYLAGLCLGSAPGSTIARHAGEKRVTTYTILKELIKKGVFTTVMRDDITYFSPISPEILVKQYEDKYLALKKKLPELMALTESFATKPKVQFYEGFEGIKRAYEHLLISEKKLNKAEPMLGFLGTIDLDPMVHEYLEKEFLPWRETFNTIVEIKSLIAKPALKEMYGQTRLKNHESLVVDDAMFDMANEVVVHGEADVSFFIYKTGEVSATTLTSRALHDCLTSIFNLIWKIYNKKKA